MFTMYSSGHWAPPTAPLLPDAPEQHLGPEAAYFLGTNRNKRSITVNFKKPEGLEIIRKLVQQSDVLVENFISGKLAAIGLGWEDCKKLNPRLIYASITGNYFSYLLPFYANSLLSGYGQTGPYAKAAGYDVIIGPLTASGFRLEILTYNRRGRSWTHAHVSHLARRDGTS